MILNYLNGLSEMKAYAFFQSLRYIIIIAVIYILGKLQYDSAWLSTCFVESEIVVFGFSVGYLTVKKNRKENKYSIFKRTHKIWYMYTSCKYGGNVKCKSGYYLSGFHFK